MRSRGARMNNKDVELRVIQAVSKSPQESNTQDKKQEVPNTSAQQHTINPTLLQLLLRRFTRPPRRTPHKTAHPLRNRRRRQSHTRRPTPHQNPLPLPSSPACSSPNSHKQSAAS